MTKSQLVDRSLVLSPQANAPVSVVHKSGLSAKGDRRRPDKAPVNGLAPSVCDRCRTIPCRCEIPQQQTPHSPEDPDPSARFAALKKDLLSKYFSAPVGDTNGESPPDVSAPKDIPPAQMTPTPKPPARPGRGHINERTTP